jgi:hypothetical protein
VVRRATLERLRRSTLATIAGSGDIDTNCAIVGGVVALVVGVDAIPAEWRERREPLLPPLGLSGEQS